MKITEIIFLVLTLHSLSTPQHYSNSSTLDCTYEGIPLRYTIETDKLRYSTNDSIFLKLEVKKY